jgi:hypothetical protein
LAAFTWFSNVKPYLSSKKQDSDLTHPGFSDSRPRSQKLGTCFLAPPITAQKNKSLASDHKTFSLALPKTPVFRGEHPAVGSAHPGDIGYITGGGILLNRWACDER